MGGGNFVNACELNAIIAGITNQLYITLNERQFLKVSLFLSQLSKNMLAMALLDDICDIEKDREMYRKKERENHKEDKEKN